MSKFQFSIHFYFVRVKWPILIQIKESMFILREIETFELVFTSQIFLLSYRQKIFFNIFKFYY